MNVRLGVALLGLIGCDEVAPTDGAAKSAEAPAASAAPVAASASAKPPPVEVVDHVQVSGRLPPEFVTRIMRQNRSRFQACFGQAFPDEKPSELTMMVRFTIDETGAVSEARGVGGEHPSVKLEPLRACVAKATRGLSFPQPEGGEVGVKFPLAFAPDGMPDSLK